MGSWATAKIFFGIDLGTNDSFKFHVDHDEDEEDSDFYNDGDIANIYYEWCAMQNGVAHPGDYKDRDSKAWQDYDNAASAFQEQYPFDVTSYGSEYGSQLQYIIVLNDTDQRGDQYSATEIDMNKIINVDIPKAVALFKEFSDKFNLDLPEPKWLLTAEYS